MSLPWSVVDRPSDTPLSQQVSIAHSLLGRDGALRSFLLRAGILSGLNLHRTCACCHSLRNVYVHRSCLCLGDAVSLGSPSIPGLTIFLPPLLHRSLCLEGGFWWRLHLGLGVLKSPTLCTLSSYGSLFISMQEEASRMRVEWDTDLHGDR